MRNTKISQNWMSIVGFPGKRKNGFICEEDKDIVFTDYIEVRIDPEEGSPLYSLIEYKKEDWLNDYPDAKPFIEKDGQDCGDLLSKRSGWTMDESIDRIIAYVHFTHDNHKLNTVFFEVGSVYTRTNCDVKSLLTEEEFLEITSFAENRMKRDFLKESKYAAWMYGEYAEEHNLIDVEENTRRKW